MHTHTYTYTYVVDYTHINNFDDKYFLIIVRILNMYVLWEVFCVTVYYIIPKVFLRRMQCIHFGNWYCNYFK